MRSMLCNMAPDFLVYMVKPALDARTTKNSGRAKAEGSVLELAGLSSTLLVEDACLVDKGVSDDIVLSADGF
jgi:hypothetical protein